MYTGTFKELKAVSNRSKLGHDLKWSIKVGGMVSSVYNEP